MRKLYAIKYVIQTMYYKNAYKTKKKNLNIITNSVSENNN